MPRMNAVPFWLALLASYGVSAAAYPSDSLLLAQIATLSPSGDTTETLKFAYSRDNQGFWFERRSEYRRDTLLAFGMKTYDPAGRLVSDSGGNQATGASGFRYVDKPIYSADGKPIGQVTRWNDSLTLTYAFQYDGSGFVQKKTITQDPPGPSSVYLYQHDSQGRDTLITHWTADSLVDSQRIAYDRNGRDSEEIFYDSKGTLDYKTDFEYDASGRVTRKVTAYSADSLLGTDIRTEYNALGQVALVKTYDRHGALDFSKAYAYQTLHVPVSLIAYRTRRSSGPADSRSLMARDILGRLARPLRSGGYVADREGLPLRSAP